MPAQFITTSTLQLLPKDYSLGNSSMINLSVYSGEGQLLPATEVKLHLNNHTVKMIAVNTNLNSGSAFSFPTPHRWKEYSRGVRH